MKSLRAETLALHAALAAERGDAAARWAMLGALAVVLGGMERAAAAGLWVPDGAAGPGGASVGALPDRGPACTPAALSDWAPRAAAQAAAAGHPDPLGWCHLLLSQAGRKQAGAYYTPDPVARYLCQAALAGLPAGARVLDPACGSGAFLRAARAVSGGQARLHGWEQDAAAAAIARFHLHGSGARIELRDALSVDPGQPFDAVVGNPPYRSSGLRGLQSWGRAEQAAWRRRFPAAAEYKLNLYPLFIEQGLRLLRPGGRLAYILPDSFLLGRYFGRLRQALLARCRVLEVCLLEEGVWPDALVGRSVLLVLEKGEPAPAHGVQVRRVASVGALGPADAPAGGRPDRAAGSQADVPSGGCVHLQSEWLAHPLARMRLFFTADDAALVRRLEHHPRAQPLGHFLRSYSGLIARAGQRSILRSTYPGGRVEVRRHGRLLYAGTPAPEQWRPLLASGQEVDRYRIAWKGEHVLPLPELIKSGGRHELYAGPKLLLRQTADDLRAAYDDTGLYCLNNLHLLAARRPDDPHDLRYWLALLNSRLLSRYYRLVALEEGRLYPQVDLDMLSTLPLRAINWSDPAERALHDQVVALVQRRTGATGAAAAGLERQVEELVEQLYL